MFSAWLGLRRALLAVPSLQIVDTRRAHPNNAAMANPEIVRRVKTYSAENGRVYQYQFHDVHPAAKEGMNGREYVYYATSDRKTMHPVKVFVSPEGIQKWSAATGRTLNSTEEYAVAKMRLFEGFDDGLATEGGQTTLIIDEKNIGGLLEKLGL